MKEAKWFWWSLLVLTIVRALFVAFVPLELVGDEAYYWDWGRHLDWGYFSKPPLIAWMMGFAGWVGGNTAVGLRLVAVALGSLTLIFAFLLARKMFDARVAFWSAAALALMPGTAVANLILTIDAPLLLCWTGALWATWSWQRAGARFDGYWLAMVGFLAVGALAKQMMLVFPLILVIYLALSRETRSTLARPALWTGIVAQYLALLPPLYWNWQNDWITFEHTAHHFETDKVVTLGKRLGWLGEFVGSQLGLMSPVLGVLLVIVLIRVVRNWGGASLAQRFLWCFSAPALGVFVLMSLRQGINPNWPAAFYPAALILLVACWLQPRPEERRAVKGWFGGALWTAFAFTALLVAAPFIIQFTLSQGWEKDPFVRMRGWKPYAQAVDAVRDELPQPDRTFFYIVGHRYHASQLAFHLPEQPKVFHWATPGHIDSQYQLWEGPGEARAGWDALIIMAEFGDDAQPPAELTAHFQSVERLETIRIPVGPVRTRDYVLFLGRGWQESAPVAP
ncbi:MAG: glycosyltransferase family 39 protein [Verrucomicrobiota bacterium JB022]|nr:glycosyltransferase family 39 protein [Verrucomicrobiota bacterium JB022]